jgi:hypothetical protein
MVDMDNSHNLMADASDITALGAASTTRRFIVGFDLSDDGGEEQDLCRVVEAASPAHAFHEAFRTNERCCFRVVEIEGHGLVFHLNDEEVYKAAEDSERGLLTPIEPDWLDSEDEFVQREGFRIYDALWKDDAHYTNFWVREIAYLD